MPKIIPVFLNHAGCPHQCAFCNQHAINGARTFSLDGVRAQITRYIDFFDREAEKELAFYGGSFTGLPDTMQEALLSLADELRTDGLISSIRLSTRPDYIDERVTERLLLHNVSLVELGAQSLDDNVLILARRGHDAQSVFSAVEVLRSAGIKVGLQFMLGLPGQGWESIVSTTQKALELRPETARIYPLLIFADTEFALAWQKGELVPLNLEDAVAQAYYMVEKFVSSGINVIRIGLQDDEELRAAGKMLSGPYHPAFGELVFAYGYRRRIENLLTEQHVAGNKVTILVPRRELSKAIGHKRSNLIYFQKKYPKLRLLLEGADCTLLRIKETAYE